jgi:hypothetical protein
MFSFRLEILGELLPHGDKKRDKASFLLEVNRASTLSSGPVLKY